MGNVLVPFVGLIVCKSRCTSVEISPLVFGEEAEAPSVRFRVGEGPPQRELHHPKRSDASSFRAWLPGMLTLVCPIEYLYFIRHGIELTLVFVRD